MTVPSSVIQRAANAAGLPKMRATFPLQVMGEMGLNNGDVWWMDLSEILFWCPELLPGGTDLRSRIDFRNGVTIEVHLRLIQGEEPLRHEKGYLQMAAWSAAIARDARIATERLRESCPEVFKPTYRCPRLPAKVEELVAEAQRAPRPQTEAELLSAKHRQEMGEEDAQLAAARGRRRGLFVAALVAGVLTGAGLGFGFQDAGSLRWLGLQHQPAFFIERGWLAGGNYAGRDFAGIDLSGADFSMANLRGATLAGGKLKGSNFGGSQLERANLEGADLQGAVLAKSLLDGANLRGTDLRGANLLTDLKGADTQGAIYSADTQWEGGTPPQGAVGPAARVQGLVLPNLSVAKADLSRADFTGAVVQSGHWVGANLSESILINADLSKGNFAESNLSRAQGRELDCTGCGFGGAKLDGWVVAEANLSSATFALSTGESLDFRSVNLQGAKLAGSRWVAADLRGASLVGADLSSVEWARCALLGTDMSRATLTGAQMSACVSDGLTIWPAGTAARNHGVLEFVARGEAVGAVLPRGVDLSSRDLSGLRAPRMTGEDVKWSAAHLVGCDLSNAMLAGGDFKGANLQGANLDGANLSKAHFGGANLSGANLAHADVCGADFATANLSGADFSRASACGSTQWPNNRPPKGITIR